MTFTFLISREREAGKAELTSAVTINRHLSSIVCLHAGLWKPMASHFRWIELLLRALSHRKYLRFFSLYNPKRCRFQLCRRLTSVRGNWPAVEIWSQHFKHRQLRFGEWYSQTYAVSRSATTTLEPLPLGRCLGLPGLLGQADWESWGWEWTDTRMGRARQCGEGSEKRALWL